MPINRKTSSDPVFCVDPGAKRQQSKLGKFKMLPAEWNSDDGNAKNKPKNQMGQRKFPSKKQDPEQVSQKTTHSETADLHILSEGPKDKGGYFKALKAKRYPHDGQATDETGRCPQHEGYKTTEKHPNQVSNEIHRNPSRVIVASAH